MDNDIIRGRIRIAVMETIHAHQTRYSEELQQKLEDLKYAYTTSYKQAVTDVMRHHVQVLEARMDTLRDLEEDVQKVLASRQEGAGDE